MLLAIPLLKRFANHKRLAEGGKKIFSSDTGCRIVAQPCIEVTFGDYVGGTVIG